MHYCHVEHFGGIRYGALISIEQSFIVSNKQVVSVQAPNWKVTVAFNIIGWCWSHTINL